MRESVRVFAEAMEKKLQRDDSVKGPWEGIGLRNMALITGLRGEVSELLEAIFSLNTPRMDKGRDSQINDVLQECCDVANYAMMIFCQTHSELKNLKRGRLENEPS